MGSLNVDPLPAPQSGISLNMAFWEDWNYHPVGDIIILPRLASTLDGFSKAFYASIMHDLGPPNDQPSPLTDGTIIEYLLQRPNRTDYLRHVNDDGSWRADDAGIAIEDYYQFAKDKVAQLQRKPAQLYAQYACSIPTQKQRGSLVVSVIVSNLVLLSASWRLLNWIAARIVAIGDSKETMNHCPGCLDRTEGAILVSRKTHSGDLSVSERLIHP